MNKLILLLAAALAGLAAPPRTASLQEEAQRLKGLSARFQRMVDAGEMSGAVFLVKHHGETVFLDAVGFQNVEEKKSMRTDSIFQIMSMTKPVTSVGVMMLVEEGKLELSSPVEKYLPEFHGKMVKDPAGPRPPARLMTVRDLLTHTCGMTDPPDALRNSLYEKMELPLAEAVSLYAKLPLEFDPGTRYAYSNTGLATAGRLIEVASGQPYERFIEERILKPLGMTDSFYFPDEARKPRIALLYKYEDGKLKRAGANTLGGDATLFRAGARYAAPEFGLYSTAGDMGAFHQMMLNGGTYQGKRILSRSSAEIMSVVHTGDLLAREPGYGWGLGWQVVKGANGSLDLLSPGAFGHGGAYDTYGFVDRSKDLVGVLMVQQQGVSSNWNSIRQTFLAMVNAAVDR